MTGRIAAIWRHPIKSHSREALQEVVLEAGRTMPGDRVWAVAHELSKADGTAWAQSANFSRAVKAGSLTAIASEGDGSGTLVLSHPELGTLRFDPAVEPQRLIDWAAPLMPADRAQSARMVRVPGRGMTDSDYPSVSLLNAASNRALGDHVGHPLDPGRWRGNFLVEGLEPWQEFDWIGRRLAVGAAELEVRERIKRCNATRHDPVSGRRDADTLAALQEGWGHTDFGIYAVVVRGGRVVVGDAVRPL
jgi:uncharacterized protein YcbX